MSELKVAEQARKEILARIADKIKADAEIERAATHYNSSHGSAHSNYRHKSPGTTHHNR